MEAEVVFCISSNSGAIIEEIQDKIENSGKAILIYHLMENDFNS